MRCVIWACLLIVKPLSVYETARTICIVSVHLLYETALRHVLVGFVWNCSVDYLVR